MVDTLIRNLKLASRMLVRHQILLSAGLSAAAGVILRELVAVPVGHPLFQYTAVERPDLYRAFVWSFKIFLFTTPLWCAKTNRGLAKGRKASVFSDSCPEFDRCLSRSNPNAHSVESRCYAASKISHCGPLQFRF